MNSSRPVILPPYSASRAPTGASRTAAFALKIAAAAIYGALVVILPSNLIGLLLAPIGIMIGLTLWMLPDQSHYPLGTIERLYTPFVILSVLWPSYLALNLPGLPWISPTRASLFLLVFVFTYSVAISRSFRSTIYDVASGSRIIWIFFLVWQSMMFITVFFSAHPADSAKTLMNAELKLACVYLISCVIFLKPGWPTSVTRMLLIMAILCTLDGFIEWRMQQVPWADYIPQFLRADEGHIAVVLSSQARSSDGLYRVRGPFPGSLILAEYLAYTVPFVVHWLITGRSAVLRVGMICALGMIIATIVVTQSRLGLVGALGAIVAYPPMWAYRKWKADPTALSGPALLLTGPAIALALLGVVFSSHTLTQRVLGGGAQAASTAARAEQRQMAIPKVLSNPIGHGLGQSGNVLGFSNAGGFFTVDNFYLTTVLDLGVVGLVSFFGLFASAVWLGFRLYLSADTREGELAGPLAVMFIVFLVVKSVLSQDDIHPIIYLMLGMLMALNARANSSRFKSTQT